MHHIAQHLRWRHAVHIAFVFKKYTDIGAVVVAQPHFIDQIGEMFLQRLIDEAALHQLQAAEVKLACHGWRQKVTQKDARSFGLYQHLLEKFVVWVDDFGHVR